MELVIDYFGNKTNGVFIEASALDGEEYSYTLFLEVGWYKKNMAKFLKILC